MIAAGRLLGQHNATYIGLQEWITVEPFVEAPWRRSRRELTMLPCDNPQLAAVWPEGLPWRSFETGEIYAWLILGAALSQIA
jgi:hypothetical protein